jgi:hypothetical protein
MSMDNELERRIGALEQGHDTRKKMRHAIFPLERSSTRRRWGLAQPRAQARTRKACGASSRPDGGASSSRKSRPPGGKGAACRLSSRAVEGPRSSLKGTYLTVS